MTPPDRPTSTLAVIVGAVIILVALAFIAWAAGRKFREFQDQLRQASDGIRAQGRELADLRADFRAEISGVRSDMQGIGAVARKALALSAAHKTEVQHAQAGIDSIPAAELEPRYRAVFPEFERWYAENYGQRPGDAADPAHVGDRPAAKNPE